MEPSQTIGQRIKLVRGELSQKVFGQRIGLSQTAVTALENDQSEPRLGTFNSIVNTFRVNPEWLRTGIGEMRGLPPAPIHLEEVLTTQQPMMAVLPNLEDMSEAEQIEFWKSRYQREALLRFQEQQAKEHEAAIRLIGARGGKPFASQGAAEEDYTPPIMTVETNPHYNEPVPVEEPARRLIGFEYGRLARLV